MLFAGRIAKSPKGETTRKQSKFCYKITLGACWFRLPALNQRCKGDTLKKFLRGLFKTIAAILGLLIVVILFFAVQANLRENKTGQEAAPSTGRFVQAGDVELFIQEMGPAEG